MFEQSQSVRIRPREYVLRIVLIKEPFAEVCTVAINDASKNDPRIIPHEVLTLGSSFTSDFPSIWDWGK
jgi:hypothetical protein